MSAYKVFNSVQFPNLNLLVGALREMGYEPEVGEALEMRGFGSRAQTAQVVVRADQIDKCYYDLGFTWNGQHYVPVVEDYAARTILGPEWQAKLRATYAKLAIMTFLARKGARIGQVNSLADGSLTISATMEVR